MFPHQLSLEELNQMGKDTLNGFIGIRFTEIGDNYIKATMPVDHRTRQPYGLLHGGASVTLAETLGSIASFMVIDNSRFICVGMEINANHVRSAREGLVTGICKPVHLGKASHVWEIRIYDAEEKLICISRLTVAILEKRPMA
jgi:1,4-dihydroxy-2-naphthoyl-CoA hydrolase